MTDDRPLLIVQTEEPYPTEDEMEELTREVQEAVPEYHVVTATDDLEFTKLPEVEAFAERVVDEIEARNEYDGEFEELIDELEMQVDALKEDLTHNSPSGGPNYEYARGDCIAITETLDLIQDLCAEELHDV